MEIDINLSEFAGIRPDEMTGEVLKLVLGDDPNEKDCVVEWQPNGFPQYKIFVESEKGEKRVFLYARGQELKPMLKAWGKNTSDWLGKTVRLSWVPQKDNDKYKTMVLEPQNA